MMLEPIRRTKPVEDDSFIGVRVGILLILGMILLGILAFRLWYLQILSGDQFVGSSVSNRERTVLIEAPRGGIYDRNGVPLVQNRAGLRVGFLPMSMPDPDSREFYTEIFSLAELLNMPAAELFADFEKAKSDPYVTYVVKEDVPENTVVAYLEEHNQDFPGIEIETAYLREYTYANNAKTSHVLGYVGEISERDLDQPEFAELKGGSHVGKDGVERQYDSYLRGKDGWRKVEVNASGKPVRIVDYVQAETGYNLYLTIDSKIQAIAEKALIEGINMAHAQGYRHAAGGAIVVMDPRSGEILSMASYPDYDPVKWVGGISQVDFAAYNSEESNRPLYNRAMNGLYPAGSTFKPFIATVAMEAGLVTWDATIFCKGSFRFESQSGKQTWRQTWKDWEPWGHGWVNLVQAIQRSCDVYFYTLGEALYQQSTPVLQNGVRRYGFGRTTGVDLPGETEKSLVPDKVWARERGTEWKTGDEINLAIGQGDFRTTPLQLAVALSAIANGGTVWVPRVGMEIRDSSNRVISSMQSEKRSDLDMDQNTLDKVRLGMSMVTLRPNGTAWEAWWRFPVDIAGKTGTAEVKGYKPDGDGRRLIDDYSLFIAYAPANAAVEPQFTVVAVMEESGHGSSVAAPVVRRVMEACFNIPRGYIGPITISE
jgi:penicillin-binding protein 2